jgi:hypothetical protein
MPTHQPDLVGKFWLGDIGRENRTMQYSTPSTSQTGLTATSCNSTLHGDRGPRQYCPLSFDTGVRGAHRCHRVGRPSPPKSLPFHYYSLYRRVDPRSEPTRLRHP